MNNISKKLERKRLKRQRKKEKQDKLKKGKKMKTVIMWSVIVLILLVLITLFVEDLNNSSPQGNDYSISYPSQGREHIGIGSEHEVYNSNPPTSGSHYDAALSYNKSDIELPDEQLIHNLEHGHIWISYHPKVSNDVIEQLNSFAGNWVLITPRSANDTDIALAAWGRLDAFDIQNEHLDTQRIEEFIIRYRNQAPESIPISARPSPHQF